MSMRRVQSPHVKEPRPGTWSNCRVYGDQVFVAGMTAHDGEGGVAGDGSMYDQARRRSRRSSTWSRRRAAR